MGRGACVVAALLMLGAARAAPVDAAQAALDAKDYPGAIKLATDGLAARDVSKSETVKLHIVRSKAELAAEDYDAAVADLNAAIDPSAAIKETCDALSDVYAERGEALSKLRRFREGADDLKRARVCEPDSADIETKLGNANFYFDRESAAAAYTEALRLKPDDKDILGWRARNFENMEQYEKALTDYDAVIKIDPNASGTYNDRATALAALGRLDEALADYNRAVALDPTNFMWFSNRAYLEYAKKDFKSARSDLDKAKQLYDAKAQAQAKKENLAFALRIEADMAQLDDWLRNAPPQ